jgi:hypothetical protein
MLLLVVLNVMLILLMRLPRRGSACKCRGLLLQLWVGGLMVNTMLHIRESLWLVRNSEREHRSMFTLLKRILGHCFKETEPVTLLWKF